MPPTLCPRIQAQRDHAPAGRGHGAVRLLFLRAELEGVDAVAENRRSVGGAARLESSDATGECEHALVRFRYQRIRWWTGIDRGVVHDASVLRLQEIEAAVFTADTNNSCGCGIHGNSVNLGRVPDRQVLVTSFLRVVSPHAIVPYVSGTDLGDPFFGTVANIHRDHGARLARVEPRIVLCWPARRRVDIRAEENRSR